MTKVSLSRSIVIEAPNDIGAASDIADLLAERANVDIKSMWGGVWENNGKFSIITDNNAKAIKALENNEWDVLGEQEVVVIQTPNQRGVISSLTNQIANAGININYLYTTVIDNHPAIVLSTDDNQKTWNLFQ